MLIDDVDRRIVALLNERTRVVEEIGRVKRESAAADLRAAARRPGVRQHHGREPGAAQPGCRAPHLRAHHR